MPDPVRVDAAGGVTVVTLDRPPVNALDLAAILALTDAITAADRNQPVILTGHGAAFCAGVDTKAFAAYAPAQKADMVRSITRMTAAILSHPAAVVAAVNGHALGGGFVLMLCADVRLVADQPDARFGLTEARAGVPFPAGPLEIIRTEIEPNLLRRLTLTSNVVGANELMAAGIADRTCPPERLADTARELAAGIAAQPAFGQVKHQMRGALAARVKALATSGKDPLAEAYEA